jgi:hypothetical protein
VKALALALCVALAATGARASEPVFDAPDKAPDVYGPLVWRFGGVDAHGWYFSDAQVQRIDLRIKYLEDRAAKECIAATNAETKRVLGASPSLWVGVGIALAVGVAGGFYLGRR